MARHMSLIVLFVLTTVTASAQNTPTATPTTRLIPFSGSLTDAAGSAFAGAHAVTFSLFDEREAGTLLWTETQTIVAGAGGQFDARLGASTALPLEIFRTEQARWLEVAVNGRALPRVMLVAVPYALRAADAETLGGKPLSDFVLSGERGRVRADETTTDDPAVGVAGQLAKWTSDTALSSSVVAESFDNRIGVFAPDPTGGGVVDARFTIRHLDNNTAIGVLNTSNQRRFALNTLASGGFRLYDGGSGKWNGGLTQEYGGVTIATPNVDTVLSATNTFTGSVDLTAVRGSSVNAFGYGIGGRFEGGYIGVNAQATGENADGAAFGVYSTAYGTSGQRFGVRGEANNIGGVIATGIYGTASGAVSNWAGYFAGNVHVTGTLSKGAGAFKIDHPLDPANKYLAHSFVESPDMKNIYDGLVTTDADGEATVTLPDWFDALNRDVRYQLTVIGQFAQAIVAEKVTGNRFRIKTDKPGVEVSWQLTGIRKDQYAEDHRIQVEEAKLPHDRGKCLYAPLCDGAALGASPADEARHEPVLRPKQPGVQ